ncbi:phage major capsid protein [Pasteurella multocida]
MAKLHELQQKRRNIAVQMRQLHDQIGENIWTDEQRGKWDAMQSELDGLDSHIQREENLRALDNSFVNEQEPEQRGNESNLTKEQLQQRAFNALIRRGFNEATIEEQKLLQEMRAQGVSTGEKGGYTVPKEFQNKVVEQMKAFGGLASISQIITTSDGKPLAWSTSDGTTEEGELVGENTAATEQDVTFGAAELGAKKLSSKVIRVSNELLQDSAIDIEAFLSRRIAERIGRAEAKYLVKGTGVGSPAQPKGLETSVTGTTQAAAASKTDWKDLLALIHSVDPAYRNTASCRLLFNDKTLKALKEQVDAQNRPLWLPGIAGHAPETILGYQYAIDQSVEDIGNGKKFAYFGDFSRFIVRRVSYMTLKRLVERYAEFDQVGFLAFHRFDCVLEDTSAIKALTGK